LESRAEKQRFLENEVIHSYLASKMTKQRLSESMSMLLGVSKKISESQEIRVSAEIQSILMRENLGTEHVKGDQLKVEYNFLFSFGW
jgi:hypothetical protein